MSQKNQIPRTAHVSGLGLLRLSSSPGSLLLSSIAPTCQRGDDDAIKEPPFLFWKWCWPGSHLLHNSELLRSLDIQTWTSVSGQRSIWKRPFVFNEPTESIHPVVLGCSCCQQQAVIISLPQLLCIQTHPLVNRKCPNTSGIIFSICLCKGACLVCFISATTVKIAPSTWRQLAAVSK